MYVCILRNYDAAGAVHRPISLPLPINNSGMCAYIHTHLYECECVC